MVANTGATGGPDAVRALNVPTPVVVEEDGAGRPVSVSTRRRTVKVSRVDEVWRLEDEWWRAAPIDRTYYRVTLESGRSVTLFRDQADGRWYQQWS